MRLLGALLWVVVLCGLAWLHWPLNRSQKRVMLALVVLGAINVLIV